MNIKSILDESILNTTIIVIYFNLEIENISIMMIHAIKSQNKTGQKNELIKIAWELHCTVKVKL